jgi:hypothetical protein
MAVRLAAFRLNQASYYYSEFPSWFSAVPEERPSLSAAQVLSQFLKAAVSLPQDGVPVIRKKLGEVLFEGKQISWLDLQDAGREQSIDRAVLIGETILAHVAELRFLNRSRNCQ